MPLDRERIAAVRRQIEAAFAAAEQPGDGELLHPQCMDDVDILSFYSDAACNAAFGGAPHWREVPDATIVYEYAALTAFSPKAFRFYLPAYLLYTLAHYADPEYAAESTLRALDPGTDKEMLHGFMASHYALLDAAETDAVVAFLELMAEDPDLAEFAEAALVNWWYGAR
ncbi:MAG: DUF6714 family protein [Rhodovibrionaceae bacterium]|nr:DUF6714 family protein [Rhodovibrionaceae bacterium]